MAERWRESVDVHDERDEERDPGERSRLSPARPVQSDDRRGGRSTPPRALLDQLSTLADPELPGLRLPSLLDQTLDRLLRIIRADVASVFLVDPATAALEPAASRGAG